VLPIHRRNSLPASDRAFRPDSPAQDVVAALVALPMMVVRLEAGEAPKEHIADMLNRFAVQAQGPHGLSRLNPATDADYRSWAINALQEAPAEHGVDIEAFAPLKAALLSLQSGRLASAAA
jgi:hypothetical protein